MTEQKKASTPKKGRLSERLSIREEQKLLTRERLLDAATSVFEEVGFRSATLEQVATRAGANRTTLYLHFKDKIDLAAGVAARLSSSVAALYSRLGAMHDPSRQDIRQWLDELLAARKRHPVLYEAAHEAITSDPAVSRELLDHHRKTIHTLLAPLIERQSNDEREQTALKIMLLNLMTDRFFFFTQIQGLEFPMEKGMDAMAALWWEGVFREKMTDRTARIAKAPTTEA